MASKEKRDPKTKRSSSMRSRRNDENDMLAIYQKRFEKEKRRLESQFKRQLEEEQKRFEKLRRDLEKERKKFQREKKQFSRNHKSLAQEKLSLRDRRRTAQVSRAQERKAERQGERMSRSQLKQILKSIRTEKGELLAFRQRIKEERRTLKEERAALDRDRKLVQEQRGGVLEAFALGHKISSKRKRTRTQKQNGDLDEEDKVFSPDSDSEEAIDAAYSFFTEEERTKRKSDRQRLISESWEFVKNKDTTEERLTALIGSKSDRIIGAIVNNGLLQGFWTIVNHICDNLDQMEELIPHLREFALLGVEGGLAGEDYNILGECLIELLSQDIEQWDDTFQEAWSWCLDLVTSTLITSHELEVAKKEAGANFNVEDYELGSEFDVNLDDLSDFEYSFDLEEDDLSQSDEVLDNI